MIREYYIRDNKITVEQFDKLAAIKIPKVRARDDNSINKYIEYKKLPHRFFSKVLYKEEVDISIEEQLNAFRNAGWRFVIEDAEIESLMKKHYVPTNLVDMGHVFSDYYGHISIGHDKISIKWKSEISRESLESYGLSIIRELKFAPHLYEMKVVATDKDALQVSLDLHNENLADFAEPNMHEYIPGRFTPTDPQYTSQWQWMNNGSNHGTVGADIKAESAWDISRGSGTRIAIIDNGFDVDHPDLRDAIDSGKAAYYVDTGGGGVELIKGLKDFPKLFHGTFCAGIALARANNLIAGCGIANEAQFIPIACLEDQVGPQSTLAAAVAYAANPDEGRADVISCSLGHNGLRWRMYSILKAAISFALTDGREGLGCPVFWAISNNGNCNISNDEVCAYSKTIAVGACDHNDYVGMCAFGSDLAFLAPGVEVLSTNLGGGTCVDTGASYAAPCAAGTAALMISKNRKLTQLEVREILQETCDKIGIRDGIQYDVNGHNDHYGYGRINANEAVKKA